MSQLENNFTGCSLSAGDPLLPRSFCAFQMGMHRDDGLLCKCLQLPSDLEILELLFIVKKATENNKIQAVSLFSWSAAEGDQFCR